ncbi:MAG: hypothetical protein QOG31_399 [Thermoplasmata archaeon]|jgi:hypothetical protein|nr:hypothetical protein [Thermoplasmata archaeon]
MTNTLARILMLTALAGLCLAALPTATAQQPTGQFSVGAVSACQPVTVNSGICPVSVPWTYSYGAPIQAVGAVGQTATLTWDQPTCPAGIVITGAFSQLVPLGTAAQGTTASVTGKSDFTLTASPDAAGEKPLSCVMKGRVAAIAANSVKQSNDDQASIPFSVKYYGLLTATIPTTIAEAGPQKEIRYDVTLTNLGNANTNVNFALAGDAPVGWSPVPPTPLVLGPSQQSGGADFTKTVSFLVSTPHKNGWNNDQTAFQLKITPGSTINTDQKGNEIAVNVLARVRGIYVPGPEPFLLVAALLGTALVARTVRKAE